MTETPINHVAMFCYMRFKELGQPNNNIESFPLQSQHKCRVSFVIPNTIVVCISKYDSKYYSCNVYIVRIYS